VAHERDPPKKDNPRYEALTGGNANSYYIARRYFNLSPEEWNDLPWWLSVAYLEGLADQGILKGDKNRSNPGNPGPGTGQATVDYSDAVPLPKGFQTRRAG
jgi:hypothetical protein